MANAHYQSKLIEVHSLWFGKCSFWLILISWQFFPSEDHKIHKLSQIPLSFHRLPRPWKAYAIFPNLSKTMWTLLELHPLRFWTANLARLLTLGTLANSQSFIFGASTWKFCHVRYPVGTLIKPDIQMTFLISDFLGDFFFMHLFFREKN